MRPTTLLCARSRRAFFCVLLGAFGALGGCGGGATAPAGEGGGALIAPSGVLPSDVLSSDVQSSGGATSDAPLPGQIPTGASNATPAIFEARPQAMPAAGEFTRFVAAHADVTFPPTVRNMAGAFFDAQDAYYRGDYAGAKAVLDAMWAQYPAGTSVWQQPVLSDDRINIGGNVPYYALRMLSDATNWRVQQQASGAELHPQPLVITILMPLRASSNQPATDEEFAAGTGAIETTTLDPRLLADDYKVLRESLWLYGQYLLACTGGRLQLMVRPLALDVTAQLKLSKTGDGQGRIDIVDTQALLQFVPLDVRRSTDQWWTIYPNARPAADAMQAILWNFAGGVVNSPGSGPLYVSDDVWELDRWRHDAQDVRIAGNGGPYSTDERLAYLPRWIDHEFFHHLARIYPEFNLEPTPHSWFDRSTWPADFTGLVEPDYYHEAMFKRVLAATDGSQELAQRLWHKLPPAPFYAGITVSSLVGPYVSTASAADPSNGWLRGVIEPNPDSTPGAPPLRWRNDAGVSWTLQPDADANGVLRSGALTTGASNPYLSSRPSMDVNLNLQFDAPAQSTMRSLQFGGDTFLRSN